MPGLDSLNSADAQSEGKGDPFLPLKDLDGEFSVTSIRDHTGYRGRAVVTSIKCTKSHSGACVLNTDYTLRSAIFSDKKDQSDAAAKDLRRMLAAIDKEEPTDPKFDAKALLSAFNDGSIPEGSTSLRITRQGVHVPGQGGCKTFYYAT